LCDELTSEQKKLLQEKIKYKYKRANEEKDLLQAYIKHIRCYGMYNKKTAEEL
jgi:hypothetical protein